MVRKQNDGQKMLDSPQLKLHNPVVAPARHKDIESDNINGKSLPQCVAGSCTGALLICSSSSLVVEDARLIHDSIE